MKLGSIVAADWSKRACKRSVFLADVKSRTIWHRDHDAWSFSELVRVARDLVTKGRGPVLILVDLALGVPKEFFEGVQNEALWKDSTDFLTWLRLLPSPNDKFWQATNVGERWSIHQPFVAVPAGKGALTSFYDKAGYPLTREVDRRCRAKSPLIVSGIPGSVGSATRSFWQELAPYLERKREFAVWPFEGTLNRLLEQHSIVIGECYPGISYSCALADQLPSPRFLLSKTRRQARERAIEHLVRHRWIENHDVQLHDLPIAIECEDAFDAMMMASAALRCCLSDVAIDDPVLDDPVAEGGILLSGAIDFDIAVRKRP